MARGKIINIYLMDGEANGRIKASISNWVGVAYKIPRAKLTACKERDDLSQSGVYFLFGNAWDNSKNAVYIGQAGVRKNGGDILAISQASLSSGSEVSFCSKTLGNGQQIFSPICS